ncbi:MFS transporter [Arcanobacterium wilhelmae]|uniref:MFS transporter n=1 Tax=Arcanobacterium wilhelmae TaxID=1803177 RepID=UPI002415499F|nr:MFS transporter [Arcanobacterium wilhelmae]WFN90094.1 MFS transporter [Arcanobacterium wilhelmae]
MTVKNPWQALATVVLGVSLIVLDGTVTSVSLPTIIADLGLTLTQAQWVSSLYTVVFAALLLPLGTLGDRIGRKKIFIAGLLVFAAASAMAAASRTPGLLIAARGLQGIGGALVLPSTLSTINAIFRGKERATAFGIWGAAMAGMAAIGPLLGGWLTTDFTWPWIFLINVPIVLVLAPWAMWVLPENKGEREPLHIGGALLSTVAFALIVFGLIEATTYGWFTPKQTPSFGSFTWTDAISFSTAALILGVVMLVAFVMNQVARKGAGMHVLLDFSLFRIPTFFRGNVAAMTVATGEFGILFALPLFLVNVLDLSTMQSGWMLASLAVGAIVSGGAARHMAHAIGAVATVALGLAIEVIGIGVTALLISPTISSTLLAIMLAFYGFGTGLASAQLASVVLEDVPVESSGMGSATQSTFRQIGSAIGVALAGTAMAASLEANLPGKLEGAGVPSQAVDGMTQATIDSAGGAMAALAKGNATILDVLHAAFANAQVAVMLTCGAFLLVGFIASIFLLKADRASKAERIHSAQQHLTTNTTSEITDAHNTELETHQAFHGAHHSKERSYRLDA